MATTSSKRTHRMRAALAAVACTLSVSLISTTTPAVAEENTSAIEKLQGVLNGDVSVASLAGAIADVQEEIARLEGELGEFRERANQALVDLQDARNLSEQARRGTLAARSELDDAQVDVEGAQEKLDEISRSAYRRANTSESVTSAAGGDAREDMLTRQSFLRSQAEKQQGTVTELERVRTEKSNKESQLRKAEQLAVEREANAEAAEDEARAVLEQNQTRVSEVSSEHEKLVALQQEAQAALSSARGEEPSESEASTEAKETSPSESPASTSEASEPSAESETSEPEAAANSESESASETAEPADASSSQETPAQSSTQNYSAPVAPSAAGTPGDAPAQAEPSQGSSVDGDQAAQLAGLAVGAAAAIIAASQPELSVDSTSGGADTSSTEATSEALVAGSSALFPQQGPAEESSSAAELAGVLEDLPTASSVEESAAAELGDASRSEKIEAVIARAESQIGVPYAWGGGDANGPTKGIRDGGVADSFGDYNKVGFDCSGLMIYAFAGVGISLPHFTGYQYNKGQHISPQEMERGDLIFYGPSGNHHVAIYLGDGMMLEAPQSGQTVTKSPVRWSGMSEYAVRLL
ncbi:DIP1281 family NlpC/P60 protein [Corynebacterium sp. J010B-136]|uniref:DIP1281 family NlpC/P60 protein n=1 Tax=Corynebacterium sp. J010B-136 TaxID=2099401 RepID=UPI000CFA7006|nr:NlpC/P60 family protein [Corynebacterium sp. J010B-136]PQM73717.1 hydrolase [Corynebacterium sp. J010B-136]